MTICITYSLFSEGQKLNLSGSTGRLLRVVPGQVVYLLSQPFLLVEAGFGLIAVGLVMFVTYDFG